MNLRRIMVGAGAAVAFSLLSAGPAFAHDCFNPNKPAGAGVNYTIVGFDANGPIFVQTGPGQGQGGFSTLDPSITGGQQLPDVHNVGNNPHEVAGGPGSQTDAHACDGKGIDYLDACFFGG